MDYTPVTVRTDPLSGVASLIVTVEVAKCPKPYVAKLIGWPHPGYRYARKFVGRRQSVDLEGTLLAITIPWVDIADRYPLEARGSAPLSARVVMYYILVLDPAGVTMVTEDEARRVLADRIHHKPVPPAPRTPDQPLGGRRIILRNPQQEEP